MIVLTKENTEVSHPSKVQMTDDQLKSYIRPDLLTGIRVGKVQGTPSTGGPEFQTYFKNKLYLNTLTLD